MVCKKYFLRQNMTEYENSQLTRLDEIKNVSIKFS